MGQSSLSNPQIFGNLDFGKLAVFDMTFQPLDSIAANLRTSRFGADCNRLIFPDKSPAFEHKSNRRIALELFYEPLTVLRHHFGCLQKLQFSVPVFVNPRNRP